MTKVQKIEICYSFKPEFAVCIGSGQGKYGIIDNAYRTRMDNARREKITIPATTAKGRIRYTFQRLMHLFPNISAEVEKDIFGESGIEGWARFSDLLLQEENDAALMVQASTAIDRFRKAAKTKMLRVQEVAMLQANKRFYGTVEGYAELKKEESISAELAYFLLAILNTTSFGGSKSTGFGKGETNILSLKIGTDYYDERAIKEKIQQLLL
ncbi:RAMP superfamily CRISPR-associated protein [Geobacillus sp. YF-1]|uniref:RAMP superfamily CRISPR-associated protein n=1 Tax=Geobacillus sp. YF-1 TaxID=3457480 RepID=UPI00404536B8